MKTVSRYFTVVVAVILSCNNSNIKDQPAAGKSDSLVAPLKERAGTGRHFRGAISNGMKGDSLFFDVSADGKRIENLTFKGYWRCSGRLEQTIAGPEGSFSVIGGKVSGNISEPPDGGSTAWRFDLEAALEQRTASGSFRMNINNLGCDTYKLKWSAVAQ